MSSISFKHIVLAFAVLALFSLCFVMGFIKKIFWLPAAVLIGAYIFIDRKYLRCPNCRTFVNLDRLFYASLKRRRSVPFSNEWLIMRNVPISLVFSTCAPMHAQVS